jgi:7SK snRNA methylphosphate capping enzyme
LYGKVNFRTENYISHLSELAQAHGTLPTERFDIITCFNTAIYIHLNFGDLGLKSFFLKAYLQLTEGGYFLLEINEWKQYKKKRGLSAGLKKNFSEI